MKRYRLNLVVSVLLNALLLAVLAYCGIQRFVWKSEAQNLAQYAGAMQAHADFGNGVRRLYRPKLAASTSDRAGYTGDREGDVEVWSWLYHVEMSRAVAESFADKYNKSMRSYIDNPNLYDPNGMAATRPAD